VDLKSFLFSFWALKVPVKMQSQEAILPQWNKIYNFFLGKNKQTIKQWKKNIKQNEFPVLVKLWKDFISQGKKVKNNV